MGRTVSEQEKKQAASKTKNILNDAGITITEELASKMGNLFDDLTKAAQKIAEEGGLQKASREAISDFNKTLGQYKAMSTLGKLGGIVGLIPALRDAVNSGSTDPVLKYAIGTIMAGILITGSTPILAAVGIALAVGGAVDCIYDDLVNGNGHCFDNLVEYLYEKGIFKEALSEKGINIKEDGQCEIKLTPEIAQCLINEYTQSPIKEIQDVFHLAETTVSPLVIDLDRDGVVETVNIKDGTYFDHNNNGFSEKTGWVGRDDGILIRDINNNGDVDGGYEVFGDNTVLSNGEKAKNGFEALADLDSNGDGVFDSKDDAWNEVKVWQDKNGNGKIDNGLELFGNNTVMSNGQKADNGFEALKDLDSNNDDVFDANDDAFNNVKVWKDTNQNGKLDDGELLTLEEVGVSKINLNYKNQDVTDENGNQHLQSGSFIDTNGTIKQINDVWFDTNPADTRADVDVEISANIASLPNIVGSGNVYDLHIAMALDTTGTLQFLAT